MVESRWRHRARPFALVAGALTLAATSSAGASDPAWTPTACPGGPPAAAASARGPGSGELSGRSSPWYRIDPVLDASSGLAGQRLVVGVMGGDTVHTLESPPESFAVGPFGSVILAGSDDGTVSRVVALDPVRGCAWPLAEERDVIRRATIDPSGRHVYEARVDRASRADLGIWRRDLVDGGPPVRILEDIPADERFGRTFSTELSWSVGRKRLVVESCGAAACRIRTFDPATGAASLLDDPAIGPIVGVADGIVVAYEACRGLPCDIFATDIATRERILVADGAGLAVLVRSRGGPRLVHELGTDPQGPLAAVDLRGRSDGRVGSAPRGTRLVAGPSWTDAGVPAVDGWIAFAPDGRPTEGGSARAVIRRITDGHTARFDEVLR